MREIEIIDKENVYLYIDFADWVTPCIGFGRSIFCKYYLSIKILFVHFIAWFGHGEEIKAYSE